MRVVGERDVDFDEILSRPLFAHLATASIDGPRNSPVWFLWEEGVVWIIGNRRESAFQDRVARDPRCALGIVDFDRERGVVQHVGFRGRATVEPPDRNRARRLLARYLGEREETWDARFREALDDSDNLWVRFEPETAVSRDQSYSPGG